MIEEMPERPSRDHDAEHPRIREVREGLPARRMILSEDQLPLRPLGRSPMGDATLKRMQMAIGEPARMTALQLLE